MRIPTVTLLCTGILLLYSCSNNKPDDVRDEKTDSLAVEPVATRDEFVTAPIKNADIPYASFTVNANDSSNFVYSTGSKIRIPKNAFLDDNGKVVTGNVQLRYREFHNPVDFFTAGIPMTIDSGSATLTFQSAGMVEINAFKDNKPLRVNPASKINVEMTSFVSGNVYDRYYLDTVSKKWIKEGEDEFRSSSESKEIQKLPEVPEPPKVASPSSFSIGDNTSKYPELNEYENVFFEPVSGGRCGSDATEIKVEDKGKGIYEITFIVKGHGINHQEKCLCYLAFEAGKDYNQALERYKNKYKPQIEKREKTRAIIEEQWSRYKEALKRYKTTMLDLKMKGMDKGERIIRTLQVNNFGFINCDFPSSFPEGAVLNATIADAGGQPLKMNTLVFADKSRNALYNYSNRVIRFNPSAENILWGITTENKFVYFTPQDFKSVKATSGNYTFNMRVHEGELKSAEEIEKLLLN